MTATVERMRHCWASTSTRSLEACLAELTYHDLEADIRDALTAEIARREQVTR